MPASFYPAPKSVTTLVEQIIHLDFELLEDARIGVLMRDEAQVLPNGNVVLGKARKVSEEDKTLLQLDFILTFAGDWWERLTDHQRAALVDHELRHLRFEVSDGKPKTGMNGHDFEAFNGNIAKYGPWWPNAQETVRALSQMPLPFAREEVSRRGAVVPVAEPMAQAVGELV